MECVESFLLDAEETVWFLPFNHPSPHTPFPHGRIYQFVISHFHIVTALCVCVCVCVAGVSVQCIIDGFTVTFEAKFVGPARVQLKHDMGEVKHEGRVTRIKGAILSNVLIGGTDIAAEFCSDSGEYQFTDLQMSAEAHRWVEENPNKVVLVVRLETKFC